MAIAAGETYSVALKADGTATVWGDNRVTVIADPPGVIGISSGAGHVLALLADGNVLAWGGNENGQAQVPFGLTNVIAVSAGRYQSLALRADGTVAEWGGNIAGQSPVPAGLTGVVAISAGSFRSLVLKSDGTFTAWGFHPAIPPPADLTNVVAISAGKGSQSLALVRVPAPRIFGTTGQPLSVIYSPAVSLAEFVATGLPPGLSIHPGTGVISGTPTQSGSWTAAITMSNLAETRQESQSFFIATGPTGLERRAAYAAWVAINWPSGGRDSLPGADPDFDGVVNMLEYASGTDPLVIGAPGPLIYSRDTTGRLVLTMHLDKDRAAFVNYLAQFSDNLDFSVPTIIAPQTLPGGTADMVQLRFTDPQFSSRQRFGRLSATVP